MDRVSWVHIIGLCCLLAMLPSALWGQQNLFFTLANVKARPLGMGGAFTSIDGDLSSISYNPAAYFLKDRTGERPIALFLNPGSVVIGALKHDELFRGSGPKLDDALIGVGLVLRSVSIKIKRIQLGFLFGEEGLTLDEAFLDEEVFRVSGYRQNHAHTMVLRLQLADKVALGATASWMFGSDPDDLLEQVDGIGFSYGILLKPEKGLNVGVSFFNLPNELKQYRVPLESILDESVNLGVSYELPTRTRVAIDVRNLGEETESIISEFHFGLEQTLFAQLALRGGYYKDDQQNNVFSFGVSLLNGTELFAKNPDANYDNFLLNYALVYENGNAADRRSHFLSLLVRL